MPAPSPAARVDEHPFLRAPHRTLVGLSIPVLFSLVAEPLTGLADTAFVARLGATALAALGVGAMVPSAVFWIFNFLGIGTQTEIARSVGAGRPERAREIAGLAITMGLVIGCLVGVAGLFAAGPAARLLGATGAIESGAVTYLRWRLLGAPAVLILTAAFGALRGLTDMRTPLAIAVGLNLANLVLDPLLIFGFGPFPALGIAGAAIASAISQWGGALWALAAVRRRLGRPDRLRLADAGRLLVVGRDLFLRTAGLTLYLLVATRAATRAGATAGAAHQAIRQVWLFTALVLDAWAHSAQSLVGYFLGADRVRDARRVAAVACQWSLGTGLALAFGMLAGGRLAAAALVPATAQAVFFPAWRLAALAQPLNSLSFITDGIHWGSGDYRFLRNVMLLATGSGILGLWLLDETAPAALTSIWAVTAIWITIRAAFGMLRVWPGIGNSPYALPAKERTAP